MIEVHRYRDGVLVDGDGDLRREDGCLVWVDLVAPDDDELARVAEAYDLHPLTLEDMAHRRQRARVEAFDDYVFVAARVLELTDDVTLADTEVHAVAGTGYLLTFADGPVAEFAAARERAGRQPDLLTSEGSAFALYSVLDGLVDGYLTIGERLEDEVDGLEDAVFDGGDRHASGAFQERAFKLKRAVVGLRRTSVPLRGGIDLIRDDRLIGSPTLAPYLRDVEEHLLRVTEMADAVRDLLTSLLEVRVGQTANDLNEVMKKLSAWAGIILVPTLIAGIYGMNFREMPELGWGVGYPLALAMMAVAAYVLWRNFKKNGWL
jgi:magnesium transporter